MTRKTAECYSHVFRFIESEVFELKPTEFITDFEIAMRNAISECYPRARLHGCWYHFSAALRKRLIKEGLFQLIKIDEDAAAIKKMMMSLPLLPANNFDEGYKHIKKIASRNKYLSKKFMGFFKYFDNFWCAQVGS